VDQETTVYARLESQNAALPMVSHPVTKFPVYFFLLSLGYVNDRSVCDSTGILSIDNDTITKYDDHTISSVWQS